MINIIMYNVKSKIENLNTLPYNVLNDILMSCSYVKKAFGVKPTRKYLIDVKSGITYTGLLSHIVPILKKNGIAYHINDMRVKPEKKYNWHIVNGFTMRDYQKRIVDKVVKTNRTIVSACTSAGKAVTLDTDILTPQGFVKMRDIHIGSKVYDENGKLTTVIGEYPQGLKDVYEVSFNDGTSVKCCKDHLWKFITKSDFPINRRNWQEESVEYILYNHKIKVGRGYNLAIPVNKPVEFSKKELPIHPYLLGAMLGDGGFSQYQLTFTNTEMDIITKIQNLVKEFGEFVTYPNHPDIQYVFRGGQGTNLFRDYIRRTFNFCKSDKKFIPEEYKMSSIEDRLELIRGLVDTDGSIDKDGHIKYCSVSEQLAKDFQFVVRSLGYRTKFSICDRTHDNKGISYHVYIIGNANDLFSSDKHCIRYQNRNMHKNHYYDLLRITDIKKLNYQEEMKCIAVDSDVHTYLCNDFIVTHNTFIMANLMVAFGCDCLVISPKASLSIQLRDEFQEFLGIKVGLINGTCVDYTDNDKKCPVIVGTPQTLLKYPEIVARAKAVLIDETHNEPADTIFKLTTMAVDAFFRVGVSGSPWRDDGCDIFLDAFAAKRNPKDTISATELINNGTLTPVSINWFNCNSGCDWLGDYATTYNQAIVNNSQRNTKAVELAVAHIKLNHPTLILFQKSKHGKKLLQMLNDKVDNKTFDIEYNGTMYKVNTVELVDGTTDLDRREAVFKSIREGKTKCMIASTIADEGLSIKQLQVLIQCGGGKSTTRLFQRIGRVIRKCDGKEHAWVYDFMDSNDTMNLHSRTRYELIKLEPAFKQTVHDINYIPEEVKKAS